MLTLALLCSLGASPHPTLLGDAPRFSARLVDAEAAPPDYSTWTHEQLLKEYDRLDNERPSLAMPITLMATGGVAFVVGLYVGLITLVLTAAGGSTTTLLILTAVLCLGGAGLLVSGIVMLIGVLHDRRDMNVQMDAIRARLDGQTPPPGPGGPEVPPPPPPPPGTLQVFAPVTPGLLVARF